LLEECKEYDPKATKQRALRKINNLLSAYNKEYKQSKELERSGTGTGAIYSSY
jgi:hypothetical protein